MSSSPDFDLTFEALLNYLKRSRGFDFGAYKRSSLTRRIQKRMQMVEIASYIDYTDYLEVHPDEFNLLFDMILINVTDFFRDPLSWDYIASDIIPQIVANKKPTDPIRIWSAGCASGEEAYTVAILLAEALGINQFRERVKIYASDVDEHALSQARQAAYSMRDITTLPKGYLEKYFEPADQRYVFRKDLRRFVIFGRHDLIQDAPISRIDLLICRNALMYFNSEAQTRILSRFHFALNERGFLFLGKAEMLFTHTNLFTPVDLKRRVFMKVGRVHLRDRLLVMGQTGNEDGGNQVSKYVHFREAAFDASPVAQVMVDLNGFLALTNERARIFLGLSAKDIGRMLRDVEFSYRIPDLHAHVETALLERRSNTLKDLNWLTSSGDLHSLEVQINPLSDGNRTPLGVSIVFNDVSRYKRLQEEIEHAHQELETAYEELQSTNEELETTNEELQSTNEELETMNEELQSTNEELQTINDEIRRRTGELNLVNAFLESILTSMHGGVVVVDRELRVQIWNKKSEDLWGLRTDEAEGKNLLNLDIGLPVEHLRQHIRACINREPGYEAAILSATNRRGKAIQCKVSCMPLVNSEGEVQGAILIMEEIESEQPA